MYLHPHIIIDRFYRKKCTVGFATAGENLDFHFFTLELPNRDNQRNVSCIPPGEYWVFKRKDKNVFQLEGVPNRTYIQIHEGNYTCQILGCILPGDSLKYLDSDDICDVTNSGATMNKLWDMMPDRFLIRIN